MRGVSIHLRTPLPTPFSSPPEVLGRATRCPQFDLAPAGVYLADPVTRAAGGLLLHRFDLARGGCRAGPRQLQAPGIRRLSRRGLGALAGGLLSVALAFALPRPGVTRQPALWGPDFPPVSEPTGGFPIPGGCNYT